MEQRRICPYCMQELEAGEEQCPHCGRELAGRNPSGSLPAGTVPVSYTHLDVYKRQVSAKVIKNGKGKKLNIITYRAKKHSARRMGHRQPFTKVEITAING